MWVVVSPVRGLPPRRLMFLASGLLALALSGCADVSAPDVPTLPADWQALLSAYPWLPVAVLGVGTALVLLSLIGLIGTWWSGRAPRSRPLTPSRPQPAAQPLQRVAPPPATLRPSASTSTSLGESDDPTRLPAEAPPPAVAPAPAAAAPRPRPLFCGGCGARLAPEVDVCPACGRSR